MKLIEKNFSKYSQFYEKYANIQKEVSLEFKKYFFVGKGLDLGCGTGFLTQVVKNDFNKIIGVDISKNMIDIYNKKGFIGITADIQSLPFKKNSIDFAVSSFALHWTDIKKSFKEIYRVLKEEGKFVFNIPIKDSLSEIHNILDKETFKFYSKDCVVESLKPYFRIENITIKQKKLSFENGKDLSLYFKLTGTSLNQKDKTIGEKLKNIKKLFNTSYPINTKFKLLFIEAIKS
ncbi:methyltransferase domain-containing protein [Hydrogenothermus marinus]|uniref:Malonyl-CoA O-methyltransferase n=1 Tax=Hydrogenothermus marinus TaxID=133270 RepID=A0A3M0BL32_9AQUI|nr:methyltransferase domain-containing protein [Hydrogenothermus marinus]RMA97144.1 malonyl-CoA O-methyltransferase [Hydrogenothermus marinus]